MPVLPFHRHHLNLCKDHLNNHFKLCFLGIFPEGELQAHGMTKNPPIGTGAADSRRVTEEEKRCVLYVQIKRFHSSIIFLEKIMEVFFFLSSLTLLFY